MMAYNVAGSIRPLQVSYRTHSRSIDLLEYADTTLQIYIDDTILHV
jgi:hypothetical protein